MFKFFRILFEHIERFFFWGWKLRGNHDWDFCYFYEIMYLKLDRMYKCFRDFGICIWNSDINKKEMRKIRIARELCKRLSNDDRHTKKSVYYKQYFFKLLNKHLNNWWD